jgi:hypothetical protein
MSMRWVARVMAALSGDASQIIARSFEGLGLQTTVHLMGRPPSSIVLREKARLFVSAAL